MVWLKSSLAATAVVGVGLVKAQNGGGSVYVQAAYPDTTYPNGTSQNPVTIAGSKSFQPSPDFFPSPWGEGLGDWADAYTKARDFVSQLTLTEKVNLTTGVGWEGERCVGQNGAIPRLGFRSMCMQDSPVGVRDTDFNSVFPAGINAAATWSRGLSRSRGAGMGAEHREKGSDVQLGPVAGPLGRNPTGGRNWEGFSSDPYLTGVLIAETVKGIQSEGVIACSKHYIGNEQEHFRTAPQPPYNITDSESTNMDDVTLHEVYLWPFADAVRAGTGSIMCSYNQMNMSYACQNSYLLNYILKGELGFQGFVMSDWAAQHSGALSALSGLDMTMPGDVGFDSNTSYWGANLTIAVLNGTVPQWRVDDAAVRIVAAWYYVGRDTRAVPINFDSWTSATYGYQNFIAQEGYGLINEHVDVRADHGELIRRIGADSTVLLKNVNNALPLKGGKGELVAVFGEDAGPNQYGPNGCPDRGCDNGTLGMAWGSGSANFPYLVTPDTGVQNRVLANGGAYESIIDNAAYGLTMALASRANVAIVFANADSGEGYITVDGNAGDRNNLTLWQDGDALIRNVSSICNNTVVVIHSTGPILLEEYKNNPNVTAILWAGVPGEQSGNSIADVLFGLVNPGAKLPFTIGKSREDYGVDVLYQPNDVVPQLDFTEGVFIDYRAFDKANITPTYEFGFGLSYTTFSYADIKIEKHQVGAYTPTSGQTSAAPSLGTVSNDSSEYVFPTDFHQVPYYIYPYLNNTDLKAASNDPEYNVLPFPESSRDGSPQPRIAAGGAPGGNPELYDVLYTVTATITNTGNITGEEVVQLYICHGGPYDPPRVLRGFERLSIAPGKSTTFTADLTRRDVSNWDTVSQNWVISEYAKTAYVGSSSRSLWLNAPLA